LGNRQGYEGGIPRMIQAVTELEFVNKRETLAINRPAQKVSQRNDLSSNCASGGRGGRFSTSLAIGSIANASREAVGDQIDP